MTHSDIISLSKQSFSKLWLMASLATLLYLLLNGATQSFYILIGPLAYGHTFFIRHYMNSESPDFDKLFSGFNRFLDTMIAGLIYTVIVGLGMMLLIVPGVILALGLSMTFNIMVEDPNISAIDALKKSWHLMNGRKNDYFIFCCQFIGWYILGAITIVGIYVADSYFNFAKWNYYDSIKNTYPIAQ